jgi:hypothetical protein
MISGQSFQLQATDEEMLTTLEIGTAEKINKCLLDTDVRDWASKS